MMNRRQHLRMSLGLLSGISVASFLAMQSEALFWREKIFQGFGTTLWLRAAHTQLDLLDEALQATVAAVQAVERQMSLFDPHSEICRLNAFGTLRHASADLRAVLSLGIAIAQHSQGAFDLTTQPLWDVWSDWAQSQTDELPNRAAPWVSPVWEKRIERARARVDWRGVQLTGDGVHIAAGMALSLNGIAQGYAADRAKSVLQAHGIAHAMLDTGETIALGYSPQGPWRLSTQAQPTPAMPMAVLSGAPIFLPGDRAVATSSDDQTRFSSDKRFHHIFDPRSGYSPTLWSRVTVLASRAAVADALTKVFFMLKTDEVLASARRWGVDVLMQRKDGAWLISPGVQLVAQQTGQDFAKI